VDTLVDLRRQYSVDIEVPVSASDCYLTFASTATTSVTPLYGRHRATTGVGRSITVCDRSSTLCVHAWSTITPELELGRNQRAPEVKRRPGDQNGARQRPRGRRHAGRRHERSVHLDQIGGEGQIVRRLEA
jgi:hypothetical protein